MTTIKDPAKHRSPMSDPNMHPADLLTRSGTSDPMEFIRIGIAAAKEKKYERALIFLAEAYNRLTKTAEAKAPDGPAAAPVAGGKVPAIALSYYGLCLALQRRQYQQGAAFCELAISAERSVGEHYHILARIWSERGNEEKAMDAIKRGLKASPGHKGLQTLRDELSGGRASEALMTSVGSLGQAVGRLLRQFNQPKTRTAPGSGSKKRKSGESRRAR